jgi:hypothetical protein
MNKDKKKTVECCCVSTAPIEPKCSDGLMKTVISRNNKFWDLMHNPELIMQDKEGNLTKIKL